MLAWKRRSLAAVCALTLLLPVTHAMAVGGSVTPTLSADALTACGADATVTLTVQGQSPPPSANVVDVMLTLDTSGSMSAGNAIAAMRTAASQFVDTMDASDGSLDGTITGSRAGLVTFASVAQLRAPLTHNAGGVKAQIAGLTPGGNTNTWHGVTLAQQQLATSPNKRVMILMTDGIPTLSNRTGSNVGNPQATIDARNAATAAKADGTELYTIGLGPSVDQNLLRDMATDPAHFYLAPTPADLAAIFDAIAEGVAGPAATSMQYLATAGADFEVIGASASKGTASHTATTVSWTLAELRTESVTVTYQLRHTGSTNGMKLLHQAADLTWTDEDDNPATQSFASTTTEVTGCNQPPVADAGPDQSVPMTGPAGATMTLDGGGSTDDGQVQPLSYTWHEGATLLGTGALLDHTFAPGTHTVTLTVNDGEFTATDTVAITVTDPFPPVTTISTAGTMGLNGWFVSPVDVSVGAEDNPGGSGVAYTVVSTDGGATYGAYGGPFTVAAEGTGTVHAYSADNAGNVEDPPAAVTLMIDYTAPDLTVTAPAGTYTDDQTLTVDYSATDTTSGVASTVAALDGNPVSQGDTLALWTLTPGDHTFTLTATDNAGNTATTAVSFTVAVTYDSVEA
ncbi:MAG TPA: VWA domain-containing protein, partial [Symbiobacteriaceae bacterium]|nr:VWA domain-containing protein [Symbiobacteriaceae bacterium]